jgi:hypothetical protein
MIKNMFNMTEAMEKQGDRLKKVKQAASVSGSRLFY